MQVLEDDYREILNRIDTSEKEVEDLRAIFLEN
jgi:hypothetical protein